MSTNINLAGGTLKVEAVGASSSVLPARPSWYERNKEKAKAQNRAWRKANPDRERERSRNGRQNNRERHNDQVRASRYGISYSDLQCLKKQQQGLCAVCGEENKLCVDHDHSTGEVRGLLCNKCNSFVGHLEKRGFSVLRAAVEYLTK